MAEVVPLQPACLWRFLDPMGNASEGAQIESGSQENLVELQSNQLDEDIQRASFVVKIRGDQLQDINVEDLPSPIFNGYVPTVTLGKKVLERGKLYC